MEKYDDISSVRLRAELLRFARLLARMEQEGTILERTPYVLSQLGELREMLLAYEVRTPRHLPPQVRPESASEPEAPGLEASRRIVEEALKRDRELQEELEKPLFRQKRSTDT